MIKKIQILDEDMMKLKKRWNELPPIRQFERNFGCADLLPKFKKKSDAPLALEDADDPVEGESGANPGPQQPRGIDRQVDHTLPAYKQWQITPYRGDIEDDNPDMEEIILEWRQIMTREITPEEAVDHEMIQLAQFRRQMITAKQAKVRVENLLVIGDYAQQLIDYGAKLKDYMDAENLVKDQN